MKLQERLATKLSADATPVDAIDPATDSYATKLVDEIGIAIAHKSQILVLDASPENVDQNIAFISETDMALFDDAIYLAQSTDTTNLNAIISAISILKIATNQFKLSTKHGQLRLHYNIDDLQTALTQTLCVINNVLILDELTSAADIPMGAKFVSNQAYQDFVAVVAPITAIVENIENHKRLSPIDIVSHMTALEFAVNDLITETRIGVGATIDTTSLQNALDEAFAARSQVTEEKTNMSVASADAIALFDQIINEATLIISNPQNFLAVTTAADNLNAATKIFLGEIHKNELCISNLIEAIHESLELRAGVAVYADFTSANIVPANIEFTTISDYAAFSRAIHGAQTVIIDPASAASLAASDINDFIVSAINNLHYAYDSFFEHLNYGQYQDSVDPVTLTTAVDLANAAKLGIYVIDADPADVANNIKFVTTATMDALNFSIATDSTDVTHIAEFENSILVGTKVDLDIEALVDAISDAYILMSGIKTLDCTPSTVAFGSVYVSDSVMEVYVSAISKAEAVVRSAGNATEITIEEALASLDDAVDAFSAAMKVGEYINTTEILTQITQAHTLLDTAESLEDQASNQLFVNSAKAKLVKVIVDTQNALDSGDNSEIAATASLLHAAIATFHNDVQNFANNNILRNLIDAAWNLANTTTILDDNILGQEHVANCIVYAMSDAYEDFVQAIVSASQVANATDSESDDFAMAQSTLQYAIEEFSAEIIVGTKPSSTIVESDHSKYETETCAVTVDRQKITTADDNDLKDFDVAQAIHRIKTETSDFVAAIKNGTLNTTGLRALLADVMAEQNIFHNEACYTTQMDASFNIGAEYNTAEFVSDSQAYADEFC